MSFGPRRCDVCDYPLTNCICPDKGLTQGERISSYIKDKPDDNTKHVHPSGATSSHVAPCFDEVPSSFVMYAAMRFSAGHIHGRGNWLRALHEDGTVDKDFIRDRYNHMMEHILEWKHGNKDPEHGGHLGAIIWWWAIASYYTQHGVDIPDILKLRTPEEEARYEPKWDRYYRAQVEQGACYGPNQATAPTQTERPQQAGNPSRSKT